MRACSRGALLAAVAVLAFAGAASPNPPPAYQRFADDVDRLRLQALVPGIAVAVFDDRRLLYSTGLGDAVEGHTRVTPATLFPIASLTKTMAAVRVFQLVEAKKMFLTSPAEHVPPATIRNLLSHTSDPPPGTRFLYSGVRYDDLTPAIESAGGASFTDQLASNVFAPAGMRATYASLSAVPEDVRGTSLAAPYTVESGAIVPGKYPDAPTAAATGVVSNVEDMASYVRAVVSGKLASNAALDAMFRPFTLRSGRESPYGLGWFVATYGSERVIWGYGQEDAFSSLLIYVPQRHLGTVLLANSSGLSAPYWLIFGNLRRSPFALAFLDDVVFPGIRSPRESEIDEALTDAYASNTDDAVAHFEHALTPLGKEQAGDPALLAALARTSDRHLLEIGERIAKRLLEEDPENVRTQYDYAVLLLHAHDPKKALVFLRALAAHPDSSLPWIASDAATMMTDLQH